MAVLGSFFRSYPITSGLLANAAATVSQSFVNLELGQFPFHHRPFPSFPEQHQPWNSRWQFGITIRPASVSAGRDHVPRQKAAAAPECLRSGEMSAKLAR